jgi:hypothetical protein
MADAPTRIEIVSFPVEGMTCASCVNRITRFLNKELTTPTLFLIARRGPTPDYIRDLFGRLPVSPKRAVDIDGGVYWMLSHPQAAADVLCDWFETAHPRAEMTSAVLAAQAV